MLTSTAPKGESFFLVVVETGFDCSSRSGATSAQPHMPILAVGALHAALLLGTARQRPLLRAAVRADHALANATSDAEDTPTPYGHSARPPHLDDTDTPVHIPDADARWFDPEDSY